MSEELRPCPFCGSEDLVYLPIVWCKKCDAQVKIADNLEDTIKLWNTRPIEDALRARIAELEEKLKRFEEFTSVFEDWDWDEEVKDDNKESSC